MSLRWFNGKRHIYLDFRSTRGLRSSPNAVTARQASTATVASFIARPTNYNTGLSRERKREKTKTEGLGNNRAPPSFLIGGKWSWEHQMRVWVKTIAWSAGGQSLLLESKELNRRQLQP